MSIACDVRVTRFFSTTTSIPVRASSLGVMKRPRGYWVAPDAVEDHNATPSSSSGPRASQKKPRVTKPKGTKGKRGKKVPPKCLVDLPTEAFNKITKYLMPSDLLSLARTNTFFRKMFLARSSQHLWRSAMENVVNMPPCPMELSDPRYISLIYSATCSNCGKHLFDRRMDPYLLVRLCDSCLAEQVEEWHGSQEDLRLLPHTHLIQETHSTYASVLKRDIQGMGTAAAGGQESFAAWKQARSERVQNRQMFGDKLKGFLDWMESGPEDGLKHLREERRNQIKTRLIAEGWKEEQFRLWYSPEWRQLVWQPTPVTDQNWPSLRSKLLPLLNKTYYMNDGEKKRRKDRIDKLESLTRTIWRTLPPLVHVTLKLPHDDKPPPKYNLPRSDYQDVRIDMPFPSTNEFLMWPMIRTIIEEDISAEDAEARFNMIRDQVGRAVVEWRVKVEQDLVEIWKSGLDAKDDTQVATASGGGQGAAHRVSGSKGLVDNTGSAALRTVGKAFPEFIITYGKPDGTTTANMTELSPNMQLLLRADVVFKGDHLYYNFPDILPRAYLGYTLIGGTEEELYGERWDKTKFERDDEMSAIPRNMLARVGRSDVSAAEMRALGRNFTCGMCHKIMTGSWEDLVRHHTAEERQARLAQAKILAYPKSGFVYRNVHDLGPRNPKPFGRFLTSSEAADLYEETEDYQFYMMSCIKCEEMEIPTRYFYTSSRKVDSPMLEHLRDVHGVQKGKMGVHFKPEPLPEDSDNE
ncbi:hypothetical protein RhiJN_00031 [Ceratobasidium sp. AG-Ba]|nr:hypothetical protein RhiJN_00031 [Ceratobasidium sp. AG-Ba]QRW01072.1 hypothetical protein RhiLY_00069 [Ceratobasidium sp. AG-Ba]